MGAGGHGVPPLGSPDGQYLCIVCLTGPRFYVNATYDLEIQITYLISLQHFFIKLLLLILKLPGGGLIVNYGKFIKST